MSYSHKQSLEILERTPAVLRGMLSGLSDDWLFSNYGPDTFSPFDVVGHMITGEKTDWMVYRRRHRIETRVFLGAEHAFLNDDNLKAYSKEQAIKAWKEIDGFLGANLK